MPSAMNAELPIGYCEYQRPSRSKTGAVLKNSGCGSATAANRPLKRMRACHCCAISSLVNGWPAKLQCAITNAARNATAAAPRANAGAGTPSSWSFARRKTPSSRGPRSIARTSAMASTIPPRTIHSRAAAPYQGTARPPVKTFARGNMPIAAQIAARSRSGRLALTRATLPIGTDSRSRPRGISQLVCLRDDLARSRDVSAHADRLQGFLSRRVDLVQHEETAGHAHAPAIRVLSQLIESTVERQSGFAPAGAAILLGEREGQHRIVREQPNGLPVVCLTLGQSLDLEEVRAEHEMRAVAVGRIENALAEQRFVVMPRAVSRVAASDSEGDQHDQGGTGHATQRGTLLDQGVQPGNSGADRDHRADARQQERSFGDDESRRHQKVAGGKERHDQPRKSEARHGTPAPARGREPHHADEHQKSGQLRHAGPLGDLDVRRRILGHETRRPEEEPQPFRRRADHREHAIRRGQIECLKDALWLE